VRKVFDHRKGVLPPYYIYKPKGDSMDDARDHFPSIRLPAQSAKLSWWWPPFPELGSNDESQYQWETGIDRFMD
jgi:hypothetical protein